MRGATQAEAEIILKMSISIHTPHAGCYTDNFNDWVETFISIHTPHAGCDYIHIETRIDKSKFQSTHPMRGATRWSTAQVESEIISIHTPHAGCDNLGCRVLCYMRYFNPHTPCGVRRCH